MQLLLIRHGLPEHSPGDSDPVLDELGRRQAERVPDAIARHNVSRIVSSPQRRAHQTAEPTAERLGLDVEIVDGLAEYDRELPFYIPVEDAKRQAGFERLMQGELPEQIDVPAFKKRVIEATDGVIDSSEHSASVALFAHGGVINCYLQHVLGNEKSLGFQIDYCSVTRILVSRSGRRAVAAVNETEHVWDLLPRNISRNTAQAPRENATTNPAAVEMPTHQPPSR
ncbi:histidine phosphatase family protein [Aldersonia sp. NBC_00410]|uniref:histidine phosphatase family protein n=1 Tax=Aldersonia sp. NBC_00410 TaxID=2975954 RepID=UPI00225BD225|nr:histidine phosphatase family protein [Aldersonia sp. NBC_00410]MCX5045087.1 histidine phosphatase family protein [Aldersonia sp. NBC_00410]